MDLLICQFLVSHNSTTTELEAVRLGLLERVIEVRLLTYPFLTLCDYEAASSVIHFGLLITPENCTRRCSTP